MGISPLLRGCPTLVAVFATGVGLETLEKSPRGVPCPCPALFAGQGGDFDFQTLTFDSDAPIAETGKFF